MKKRIYIEDFDFSTIDMFEGWGYEIVQDPEQADMIVFTGGTDVDPTYYGEQRGPYTDNPDVDRDKHCEHLYWTVASNGVVPCVGICRGAQFITAMQGGRLKQHITDHKGYLHSVVFPDGTAIEVTSSHHQEMIPPKHVDIIGTAPDGTVEITSSYQKNGWKELCVQGHPEWVDKDHPFQIGFMKMGESLLGDNQ